MITIQKNQDFQNIYKSNIKYFGKYVLIYIITNKYSYNRFGFVVSKKTGNSPIRNRIKRLFREVIRLNFNKIKTSLDIIIISKKVTGLNVKTIKCQDIEKDILNILKKAKVFL